MNNTVFWSKPAFDKFVKDVVGKEPYVTVGMIIEKCKINGSLAREAIVALREENKIVPVNGQYHSRFCSYVKTPEFAATMEKEKAEVKETKAKKGGKGTKK